MEVLTLGEAALTLIQRIIDKPERTIDLYWNAFAEKRSEKIRKKSLLFRPLNTHLNRRIESPVDPINQLSDKRDWNRIASSESVISKISSWVLIGPTTLNVDYELVTTSLHFRTKPFEDCEFQDERRHPALQLSNQLTCTAGIWVASTNGSSIKLAVVTPRCGGPHSPLYHRGTTEAVAAGSTSESLKRNTVRR